MVIQLIVGSLLGVLISLLAWRFGSLSPSGALSAFITGGLIFGLGGFRWGTLLLSFFITSSMLSKAFTRRKQGLREKFSKGGERDWGQVFANGGLGTMLVCSTLLITEHSWPWFAYAGAMAAVNADTWATELGVLNPTPPRLITTGRRVEPGTSGGISLYGMVSTLAGALLIGIMSALFSFPHEVMLIGLAATTGGISGSIFDSFLGATVQAIYHCPSCDKETERHPRHLCGTNTKKVRGWKWLNNDMVNFLASVVGALIAVGFWLLFS